MMISFLVAASAAAITPSNDGKTLEERYRDCWERNSVHYAATGEPAETVVIAARAACEEERQAHRSSALKNVLKDAELTELQEQPLDEWEAQRHGQMIQRVLEERAGD